MRRGNAVCGCVLIVLGILIMAFSVPSWAWGAVIGIVFVTVGVVCIRR